MTGYLTAINSVCENRKNHRMLLYLLPTSMEVPDFEIAILDLAPSPRNPLGVKGAGEIGIVATGAALANAVSNALGVHVRELPLSPHKIRELIGRSLKP